MIHYRALLFLPVPGVVSIQHLVEDHLSKGVRCGRAFLLGIALQGDLDQSGCSQSNLVHPVVAEGVDDNWDEWMGAEYVFSPTA